LKEQTTLWSTGYVFFVLGAGWCAIGVRKKAIILQEGDRTNIQEGKTLDTDDVSFNIVN